jgi:zinc/manganese transport system substrate-binding protein
MIQDLNAGPIMIPSIKTPCHAGIWPAWTAPLVAALVLLAACRAESSAPPAGQMAVVTSNVILADFVRQVGGDRVSVTSLIPPGTDLHSFQTTPQDSIAVSRARVIVTNGMGLDDFLLPVLKAAQPAGAVHVVASAGLETLRGEQPAEDQQAAGRPAEDDHLAEAPHFWLDPLLAASYVERIRDGLAQADPPSAETYRAGADRYIQLLRDLDRGVAKTLDQVPPARRRLVTYHNAFGYFARRYGWQTSSFIVAGGSEVTPGQVAAVLMELKEQGIPAVFAEPQFRSDVLDQAARDAGVEVGIIYSDVLDATAPTYLDLMRFNANSLVKYLK